MHWIDPDSLPETVGRVDQFLINRHGEVDGMMLADGTEVHLPPHMGPAIVKALRPGVVVRLRAVRPRAADVLAAVAFETEDGTRYVDDGPPKDHKDARKHAEAVKTRHIEVEGVVRCALHGPKGETRGLLLEDGRSGRFPPHAADGLRPLLKPGAAIALRGESIVTKHGTVIAVDAIGPATDALRPIEDKPHKPKDHHKRHKKPHHAH
jgi:hypothetical protein